MTANLIQIKKAYRLLALKYHPDVCKLSNASELFIKVQEAYEILSDENKRNIYDRLREPHTHTIFSNSSATEDRIKYRQWALKQIKMLKIWRIQASVHLKAM